MIALPSINGSPRPMEERFARLKDAGFDALLLWWGAGETEDRMSRVQAARRQGMHIENVHADTDNLNALWYPGAAGEKVLAEMQTEVEDCARCGVETMVLHLTNGKNPPPVTKDGIERVEMLILLAEKRGVRLAFENMRTPAHTAWVLDHFHSPFVGLCYDSGHHHLWTADFDWLETYAHRLMAIHLHDNKGTWDAHKIPFDGTVDWTKVIVQLKQSAYRGSMALEAEFRPGNMYDDMTYDQFLLRAQEAGMRLEQMLRQSI